MRHKCVNTLRVQVAVIKAYRLLSLSLLPHPTCLPEMELSRHLEAHCSESAPQLLCK